MPKQAGEKGFGKNPITYQEEASTPLREKRKEREGLRILMVLGKASIEGGGLSKRGEK